MQLSRPSLSELISQSENGITSRLTSNSALLSRSLLRVVARVFAGLVHGCYGSVQFLASALMVMTARGRWLDWHGQSRHLPRLGATRAEGTVRFSGVNGSNIPAGTIVSRTDGEQFETLTDGTISGGVSLLRARSLTAGDAGNTTGTTVLSLVTPTPGVSSDVIVESPGMLGGAPAEMDEPYRERILFDMRSPAMGGSEADYIRWARAIPGIGAVSVFANDEYNGLCTVAVVCASNDPANPVPSQSTLDSVSDSIQQNYRPVTAVVDILPVTAVAIGLTYRITPFTPALADSVREQLVAWARKNARARMKITLTELSAELAKAGVADNVLDAIEKDAVGQPVENVQLVGMEYPVFLPENIIISELT